MSESFPDAPSPEGVGFLLHAMLNEPASGPPFTHTFQPPYCECGEDECVCPPPPAVSLTVEERYAALSPEARDLVVAPDELRRILRDVRRQILRAFRLNGISCVPPLAIDGHAYRRRQRNRVKRRRRR